MVSLVDAVIEDPYFADELTLYRYQGDVNRDGRSVPAFESAETVVGIIRPESAVEFEVGETGQVDGETLCLLVSREHGIAENDRIEWRGTSYRATAEQTDYIDEFSLFVLPEDSRDPGEGSRFDDEDEDEDESDSSGDSNSDSGSGSDYEVIDDPTSGGYRVL